MTRYLPIMLLIFTLMSTGAAGYAKGYNYAHSLAVSYGVPESDILAYRAQLGNWRAVETVLSMSRRCGITRDYIASLRLSGMSFEKIASQYCNASPRPAVRRAHKSKT